MASSTESAAAVLLLAAALLPNAASAAPAAGQPDLADWRIERSERTWPVTATGTVRVINPHGNLVVRVHERPEVYLLANTQRHRDDPRGLEVAERAEAEALSLEIGFAVVEVDAEPAAWTKRRCDVTVFVPAAATTHFTTHSGSLEVRGTRAPTEVETWSGDLRLRIAGAVTARTEHGRVLAQFLRTDWERPVHIASRTGEIRVEIPDGGRAEVSLTTRGEVTSDFSTTIERTGGDPLKRARLSIGQGGPSMLLESQQGPIKVIQSLVVAATGGGEEDEP